MKIWVDADACPVVIKEILFRAAIRTSINTTLVANAWLRVPPSPFINAVQVDKGFDVADNYIVQALQAGDLVITADIPLAAQVIAKSAHALNPRGEMYSDANIAERLAMRNMMDELRNQGAEIGGPAVFNQADRQAFAAELDKFIARLNKNN
ncbi:MAG: YaiI/YqxD family protein [Pseudomonadota bacterium]